MRDRTSVYSSSVGNSIQASAKNRDSQKVGCTGPIKHARPPSLITLHRQHEGSDVYTSGGHAAVLLHGSLINQGPRWLIVLLQLEATGMLILVISLRLPYCDHSLARSPTLEVPYLWSGSKPVTLHHDKYSHVARNTVKEKKPSTIVCGSMVAVEQSCTCRLP